MEKQNQGNQANGQNKGERIAKVMARAGLCSRREAERWIEQKRVQVDGSTIQTPATIIHGGEKIVVDGKELPNAEKTRLFLYHKPTGLVTSNKDEQGRLTIFDKLPKELPRLMTVGRLDINTEGLLLMTNDGELARYLELPGTGLKRTYRVRAHGRTSQDKLDSLKKGVVHEKIRYKGIEAKFEKQQGDNAWVEVTLQEGKNREVRNVMEAIDLKVNRLIRVSYGSFHLGSLPKGSVMEVKTQALKQQLPGFFKDK